MIQTSETSDTSASGANHRPTVDPVRRPGEYRAPLPADGRPARLIFERGTANDTIIVDPTLTELFVARFDGAVPHVKVTGAEVRIRNLRGRRHRGWITLSGRVPWAIDVRGGAARVRAELDAVDITEVEISGGASHVDLELPAPRRVVPVRIGGGVSSVTLLRPRTAPVRLAVAGGAAKLALDEQRFGAVGGPVELSSSGYDASEPHYDVRVGGGAHALLVAAR
jgi:hypothetical protein